MWLILSLILADPPTCGDPSCEYVLDSGASNNTIGLNTGDFCWMSYFEAVAGCNVIQCIRVEFGPVDAGRPETTPVRFWIYDDPTDDNDPSDAILVYDGSSAGTVVMNEGQPVFNAYPIEPTPVSGGFFVAAAVDGEFPAAIDQNIPGTQSWAVFNLTNPDDPLDAPGTVGLIGDISAALDGTWMLRCVAAPYPPPCEGDTNGDFTVGVDDLNNVVLDWSTNGSTNGGDLTGPFGVPDGVVDVNDLNAVIVHWGDCPLVNDDCADASPVGEGETAFQTIGATLEPGSPPFSCGEAVNDVWFRYTVPGSPGVGVGGMLHVGTCGSAFDTLLEVYAGDTCAPLLGEACACDDDDGNSGLLHCPGTTQSALSFGVPNGHEVLIRVGGKSGDAEGAGVLTILFEEYGIPGLSNDTCEDALFGLQAPDFELVSGAHPHVGTTWSSGPDPQAAACSVPPGSRGVWYWFEGDGLSKTVELDCANTDAELRMDLLCVENGCDDLSCLDADIDECVGPGGFPVPTATFCSEPGRLYAVYISYVYDPADCAGGSGNFELSLTDGGPCRPPAACGAP